MKKWNVLRLILAVIATLVAAYALVLADKQMKQIIFVIWIIGVPVWFGIEYWYLKRKKKIDDLDHFKYGQELARNIWAGVAVVLGLSAAGSLSVIS